jgi:putative sigma-54 modulation protein
VGLDVFARHDAGKEVQMSVDVTARHMHASDPLQNYARAKGEKLIDEFPRVEHVHIILDREKRRNIVEIVVQAKNRIRVEAEESSENVRAAVDLATDKAEKQLRRLRDKVQEHRNRRQPEELLHPEETGEET